jgi:hypothetical protein
LIINIIPITMRITSEDHVREEPGPTPKPAYEDLISDGTVILAQDKVVPDVVDQVREGGGLRGRGWTR